MPQATPAPPTPTWHLYRSMVGVGIVCGLMIVTVFQLTRSTIERNRAEALEHAILEVLPGAETSRTFLLDEDSGAFAPITAGEAPDRRVHAAYDPAGHPIGLAVEAAGMGYQDVIHVLYGYSFEEEAIVGIRVLESKETPGLGDRIEKDPDFLANFERLDVALSDEATRILHPIEAVKHGDKEHPWQIDGITGATISSVAVADMLRVSTDFWIPRLRGRLEDFRARG